MYKQDTFINVKFQLLSFNVLWQRCQCINKQSPQKGTENNVAGYRSPLCRISQPPFAELLARGNECTIHIGNLQKLMLEIYKCLNSENPSFMWNIFQTKDVAYNLRTQKLLQLPSTNTLSYGNDSLSFRGAILWNTLSDSIKSLATSASCKRSIKEWKGGNCSCKICR